MGFIDIVKENIIFLKKYEGVWVYSLGDNFPKYSVTRESNIYFTSVEPLARMKYTSYYSTRSYNVMNVRCFWQT